MISNLFFSNKFKIPFIPLIHFNFSTNNNSKFNPTPNRELFKKYYYKSFYRRSEPNKGVNFISKESKNLLKECLIENTANPFFEVIDQYKVQDFPSFCGLTNLTIILNTLKIDPQQKWKGIWRWYDEYNTKCINIENVFDYGMTLCEFKQLLKCNSVSSLMYRPILNDKNISINNHLLYDDLLKNKFSCIKHKNNCCNKEDRFINYGLANYNFFKLSVLSSTIYNNFILMTSLSRKKLNQTGDGHFAPVVAYHKKKDLGLLLDVAKFKYDSRWYNLKDIYDALFNIDTFTNKSRGFFIIKKGIKNNLLIDYNMFKKSDIYGLLKYNNDESKMKILNWLSIIKFNIKVDKTILKKLWNDYLLPIYKTDYKFKTICDFIYMYDNENYIENIMGCIIYNFNKK